MLNRLPWRTLGVAAGILLLTATPGAFGALALDRSSTLGAEPWRVITGHLVHTTGNHLAWNLGAFVLLGVVFERQLGRRLWSVLLASAIAVGAGMLALAPDVPLYCGLSGVLNGIFVGGALLGRRRELEAGRRAPAVLLTAAVVAALAKIVVEAALGVSVFTDAAALGGAPVPLAHALGSLGGLVALVGTSGRSALRRQRRIAAPPQPLGDLG